MRQVKEPTVARRKRRSPEEIMDLLLQAAEGEFKKYGYSGATTAAIAREADITEAQLFRYFSSKAELFQESIFKPLDRHFAEFNARHLHGARGAQSDRRIARIYITELQQFIAEHCEMIRSMVVAQSYASEGTNGVAEIGSLRTYFDHGAAILSDGPFRGLTADPRLVVRVSFAAVLANVMFKDWLFPNGLASESEIRESIIDFVIDGLSSSLDPKSQT